MRVQDHGVKGCGCCGDGGCCLCDCESVTVTINNFKYSTGGVPDPVAGEMVFTLAKISDCKYGPGDPASLLLGIPGFPDYFKVSQVYFELASSDSSSGDTSCSYEVTATLQNRLGTAFPSDEIERVTVLEATGEVCVVGVTNLFFWSSGGDTWQAQFSVECEP
jgi:hypothetical protein